MNATWLVAKYMDDLRRREPKNVGVILLSDHGSLSRFKGEKTDGEIDGRKINVGSVENYKAWVEHWKRTLREGGDRMRLLTAGTPGNYSLEFGGERLLGNADLNSAAFLDLLYRQLVEDVADPPDVVDPRRLIERMFDRLKIREKIFERPSVVDRTRGVEDPLAFDYRYKNGINVLMKRVHLAKDPWATVHETGYNFTQARVMEPDTRLVPLVSHAPGIDPGAPIKILTGIGGYDAIDVSDEEKAASGLIAVLELPRVHAHT
jgi:hypothetical protein